MYFTIFLTFLFQNDECTVVSWFPDQWDQKPLQLIFKTVWFKWSFLCCIVVWLRWVLTSAPFVWFVKEQSVYALGFILCVSVWEKVCFKRYVSRINASWAHVQYMLRFIFEENYKRLLISAVVDVELWSNRGNTRQLRAKVISTIMADSHTVKYCLKYWTKYVARKPNMHLQIL